MTEYGIRSLELADCDVVLTTFPIIQDLSRKDGRSKPLLSVKWWRLVVDEIQLVANDTSQIARAMQSLDCKHIWMLRL